MCAGKIFKFTQSLGFILIKKTAQKGMKAFSYLGSWQHSKQGKGDPSDQQAAGGRDEEVSSRVFIRAFSEMVLQSKEAVALVAKNPPINAGDTREVDSIFGLGKIP